MGIIPDDELNQKIHETHAMTQQILENTKYLSSLNAIATTLNEIKVGLLAAATGRDQVPVQVVEVLMKMCGWVIFGLVMIMVFFVTGKHLGWIGV